MDFNVKTSKIINFFSQLEKKEIISQSNLAKSVLISLGMANAILKKAISKGYVKAKAAPYKKKGDNVKIKKGDNFFLEGIFQESIDLNRSLILTKFLNREVKTFVQNNLLEV